MSKGDVAYTETNDQKPESRAQFQGLKEPPWNSNFALTARIR